MYGKVYHHLDAVDRNGTIKKKFEKCFGNINTIAIMNEVETFGRLALKIGVSLIEIGPDVGTRINLELQLLLRLHDLRS